MLTTLIILLLTSSFGFSQDSSPHYKNPSLKLLDKIKKFTYAKNKFLTDFFKEGTPLYSRDYFENLFDEV